MSASYSVFTSPNHAPIPNHLPTLIVTPHGQPHHTLYSYIHTNMNKETYLLTPSPQGDLCVAKMVPPPGSRGPGGPGDIRSDPGHSTGDAKDRSVRCEASRNLKWSITNTGINAPVYKLTLPNPDAPGHEQPLFQISKPNPNAPYWTMFYFTYAGHLIPPKRIEFGKIQKNAAQGSGGGGGTRVTISGKSPEEKAVWQTLGEGNEDMVEWIVLCAALNVLDEEIIKAAAEQAPPVSGSRVAASLPHSSGSSVTAVSRTAVPSSRPSVSARTGGVSPYQQMPVAARGPPPSQQRPLHPDPRSQGAPPQKYAPQQTPAHLPVQQAPSRLPIQQTQGAMPLRGASQYQYQEGYRPSVPSQMPARVPPHQGAPLYSASRPMAPSGGRAPGGGIVLTSPPNGYGADGFGGGGFGPPTGMSTSRPPQQAAGGGRRF